MQTMYTVQEQKGKDKETHTETEEEMFELQSLF